MAVPTKENREYLTANGNAEDKFAGYDRSMVVQDDSDHDMDDGNNGYSLTGQYTAGADVLNEHLGGANDDSDLVTNREKAAQIASRETDYQKRRFNRALSPRRADPLAEKGTSEGESLKETLARREIEREEARVQAILRDRETNGDLGNGNEHSATLKNESEKENGDAPRKRKRRWDGGDDENGAKPADEQNTAEQKPDEQKPADAEVKPKKKSRFDLAAPVRFANTPAGVNKTSRWDSGAANGSEAGAGVPAPAGYGFSQDYTRRNIPLSDKELDILLPGPDEGYQVVEPPANYAPAMMRKAAEAILPPGGFMMQQSVNPNMMGKELPTDIPGVGELQFFKESDMQYFGDLMKQGNDDDMSVDELKQRKIMRLLLKIKNGTPPMRKTALRQITDNARQFGAKLLLDQILPLLMEKTLEDQERHLLVKVIDRILYKLDDQIREEVHRILTVIEPMLLDQDHYARVEGREIISNLAKAAGLATMIAHMRPQIDNSDEYVRNSTARSFAIVASALGIQTLIPFLRAVCRSKKSWTARHTGVKIIQQIAILQGNGVLPHLKGLVECIGSRLNDEQVKVKTITALAIAALAEASSPYGIEAFDQILEPLWDGARRQRGKGLTGFLKAIGHIIPLMGEEYTTYYVTQITPTVQREFNSPDEEMKQVVLRVVQQIAQTQGVQPSYLKETLLPDFLKSFWIRRMALERRNYRQVVDTTVVVGGRVGPGIIIDRIVKHLKDDSESFRKMTMETIDRLLAAQGAADIDPRLEERLIDGALHAYQEQSTEEAVILNGFGTIVSSLDVRVKPYMPQIVSTILWRLNHKLPSTRQQAADLVARVAPTMRQCGEDTLMVKISQVLYEYLGEEYPDVLGSILGAMRSIVTVVGLSEMQPPIRDLLPRLTPILRNRHERVQENTIDLIGRIADRGPDAVSPREWMRICFELLDMLKAHKKGIRRAANNTFGYIAKAIGPQDVLSTLLNNLRVQERQSRVCTAVAIGIIAETCAPFTILPALMNEYRVPELNVQNGVLKALSFLFEYIGDMAKDYVYAVTPLLEDALIDRDQVHRQTAASVVKHLALGVVGLGCEDAMLHLLNLVFPNIFETSPHVINRVVEAIEGLRNAVGPGPVLNYAWSGLFHPARKVRVPYWRVYDDCYVQQADAMIPYFPDGSDIGGREALLTLL